MKQQMRDTLVTQRLKQPGRMRLADAVRRFFRDDDRQGGQAMVEFAIAFPLQLFITFAIAQLILIYVSAMVVNFAAYRACRAAIVDGDPHRAAAMVLSPLTSRRANGFDVDPDNAITVPGWGVIRNSHIAYAKSDVYVTSEPDDEDVTVVVEYHQELILPVVDRLFATFLSDAPLTEEEADRKTFGIMRNDGPTVRVHGQGGPYIRELGDTVYLVLTRECTMYREPLP